MGRYFALFCRDRNDWMNHRTSRKHAKLETKGFFLFFTLLENAAGIIVAFTAVPLRVQFCGILIVRAHYNSIQNVKMVKTIHIVI